MVSLGTNGPCLVAPAHQLARIMGYRTPAAPLPCTLVEMVQSHPVARYHVPTPPLWANPLWCSSPPVLDIKEPLNSLLWAERVEKKEAEAAAHATAPADVLPESSIDGQTLLSTPADQLIDLCLALRGWTCPRQCAVSVLDSFSTSSSRSRGGIGRTSAVLSLPQQSTGC